eukprot:CAMPEP_0174316950 /NCGR_PEP_ID=MMETSP0810-20121108/7300_1 /TAXON_ID=73025 ORGANISM="Eutreptiella gymnastica-like, Strain CCMP1594" /NCGR_SAMPLE_ID=MMETSP0810 /ASSEMBLY_ACC=CAM_ASM_000659 /LENGTH=46 /DNA_ID= /DNA_START= /DNA_END= /DNA_ORIENTATION=
MTRQEIPTSEEPNASSELPPLAGGAQDLHQNSIAEVGYDSSPKDML